MYPAANNVYSNYSALLSQGIHLGQMRQANIHIEGMLNNNIQQNSNMMGSAMGMNMTMNKINNSLSSVNNITSNMPNNNMSNLYDRPALALR